MSDIDLDLAAQIINKAKQARVAQNFLDLIHEAPTRYDNRKRPLAERSNKEREEMFQLGLEYSPAVSEGKAFLPYLHAAFEAHLEHILKYAQMQMDADTKAAHDMLKG